MSAFGSWLFGLDLASFQHERQRSASTTVAQPMKFLSNYMVGYYRLLCL